MLRRLVSVLILVAAVSSTSVADDVRKKLKKQAATLQKAAYVITNYKQGQADPKTLAKAHTQIEAIWYDFAEQLGKNHPFAQELAFTRARSVTAAKKKKKIIPAWKEALKQIPANASQENRINLYMEAGYAASVAEKYDAAEVYFGYARTLAVAETNEKERTQLYMRINELKTTGRGMEWRPLRDALSDFRKASQYFNLWSVARLDALIGEAEVRVAYQPESAEKRTDLSELKAHIVLVQKNLDTDIPPSQLKRLRNLMYVLEDYWQL